LKHNQYIPHVGNVCLEPGIDFSGRSISWNQRIIQESTLLFTWGADNYWRITTTLTLVLTNTREVKNMNSHKYASNRSQDTQNNLHSSASNLALIVAQPK